MANLTEQATFEPGIYQIERTDPIQGGEDGISNLQAKQLANRTKYLKENIEVAHNADGSHKVDALKSTLVGALTDAEFAPMANLSEEKLNLYFRGTPRPGNLGAYTNTRQMAEDIVQLDTMNAMGDLMLNKTTLDSARNLCKQFYSSSGIIYAGATALAGHTPVIQGEIGGGIFTIDDPTTVAMPNKLRISGIIQYLIDGFCIRIKTPALVELPAAPDIFRSIARKDLVYVRTHLENITVTNKFYTNGDVSGDRVYWDALLDMEKKLAAVTADNNLFIGADYNVYQLQYEWKVAADASTLTDVVGYSKDVSDSYMFVDGTYKAIEICKVTRRNKGAYHSVLNPLGTAAFYGATLANEQNQQVHSGPIYPITAVDTVNNTFTIVGNLATSFPVGTAFNVSGAINGGDDNSRDYEVVSAANVAANTVITVTRDLTLNTGAHGSINKGWPSAPFYSISATDTTNQTFTIAGNQVEEFPIGFKMGVLGTTNHDNDGDFVVTGCSLVGANTVIKIGSAIANSGNTGKLHSLTWFHINYCYHRMSMGLNGLYSGSVAAGVVAYSETSNCAEFTKAHDHFLNTDIADLRTYLASTDRVVDPNLQLSTPSLSGVPLTVFELDTIVMKIDPYNDTLTYTIQAVRVTDGVAVGTITRVGSSVMWAIPEITSDVSVRLSISVTDGAGHISATLTHSVLVQNLIIAGDSAVVMGSADWESVTGATVTSGFVATVDAAVGLSNHVSQGVAEPDWGKYQVKVNRGLYKWAIAGSSTVSTLGLIGTHAVTAGQLYAVKYTGNAAIVVTTLGVTGVTWNSSTSTNTLTLGTSLSAVPEMIWDWDGEVAASVGNYTEALVPETALVIDTGLTTTTQVVGSSAMSRLWVNEGYHSKVKVTVGGVSLEVPVLGINEFSGVYTLQIPEQDSPPSAMVKPNCFVACESPTSLVYNSTSLKIDAIYAPKVVFGNDIRRIKFKANTLKAGAALSLIQADLWIEG